jgi:Mn-dependent DtxR family transcriptional regulator
MSISSLAKVSNVLSSAKQQMDQTARPDEPTDIVLRVLRDGRVPLSELSERTRLSPDVCVEAVEKLRSRELVEVVEITTPDKRRYVQLTSAGYATFFVS